MQPGCYPVEKLVFRQSQALEKGSSACFYLPEENPGSSILMDFSVNPYFL